MFDPKKSLNLIDKTKVDLIFNASMARRRGWYCPKLF